MITVLLALAAVLPATPAAAQTITKKDEQWASEGPYLVYASPWCRRSDRTLLAGRDYVNTASWTKGSLPNNVKLTWQWPGASRRRCGVYGYNFVAWGNYDGGATLQPVAPRQVKDIGDLTFSYGVDFSAPVGGFNGLAEFFLTRTRGRAYDKAIEIGFFWYAPQETQVWARSGRQLGTFTDRYGKRWTAVVTKGGVSGTYVTFTPLNGIQSWGVLDAKGAIDFLRTAKLVQDGWWFNGAAIGVEPLAGFGTAFVRQWKPTLK